MVEQFMQALGKAFGLNLCYRQTLGGYQIIVDNCYIGVVSNEMVNDPQAGSDQLARVTMEMLISQYASRCADLPTISNGVSHAGS